MPFDAVTIVIIVGVVAVLVLVLSTRQRGSVGQVGAEGPRSRWLGTAAWLGILGASSGASHTDGDTRGGDDHGVGGDWSGPGGGDDGGGGWGGGDFGGGGDGGGGGGGGGGD